MLRPAMKGMRQAAEDLATMLGTLADEIDEHVACGIQPLRDGGVDPREATASYGVDTSLGMLIWRDPRRDDGRLPTSNRFPTARIVREGSLTTSIRLPHRTPRSALRADDQQSLAVLLRSISVMIEVGDWSPRTSDMHAATALYAASGGREGILRWPNPWTGASFTTMEAIGAGHEPNAVPIETDFDGWHAFAEGLTPCLDMTAAFDRDTGIHTLDVSLRTEAVQRPGNSLDALRALAAHRRERTS